jgi:hypothetical protein
LAGSAGRPPPSTGTGESDVPGVAVPGVPGVAVPGRVVVAAPVPGTWVAVGGVEVQAAAASTVRPTVQTRATRLTQPAPFA